jgi:type 1 glutamine amidotransferase
MSCIEEMKRVAVAAALGVALLSMIFPVEAAGRKILLISGKQSHGPGDHEFRAGCLLLKKCLDRVPGIVSEVHSNGWPADAKAFEDAAAVLIYADGGGGHPAIQGDRPKFVDELVKKGVGLGFAHFGVEVPKGQPGEAMHRWIGGYYEDKYSVNPMWQPDFKSFPDHPVTRGVKPFALIDEWYFNIRWGPDMKGVTPILIAKPSEQVRNGPYVYPPGPYPHIQEAKGRDETMMWVFERPDGGRGFGFTGGHKHVNWANENFRKVVLNALLWIAKADVPANGVESQIEFVEVTQNLDPKGIPAEAPNLSGHWQFKVETSGGSGEPTFDLVHAGQNLLGRYKGRFGEADAFGSVKEEKVSLKVSVMFEGQEREMAYTGKIADGKTMNGTVKMGEFEGTWSAAR